MYWRFQDLTISGNVISLTGQSGNVDLTSTLAGVAGNYGDANVHALGEGNWTGNIIISQQTNYRWKDLYLSGTTINLGGTTISRLANGSKYAVLC